MSSFLGQVITFATWSLSFATFRRKSAADAAKSIDQGSFICASPDALPPSPLGAAIRQARLKWEPIIGSQRSSWRAPLSGAPIQWRKCMGWILIIVVGGILGWLASKVMRT